MYCCLPISFEMPMSRMLDWLVWQRWPQWIWRLGKLLQSLQGEPWKDLPETTGYGGHDSLWTQCGRSRGGDFSVSAEQVGIIWMFDVMVNTVFYWMCCLSVATAYVCVPGDTKLYFHILFLFYWLAIYLVTNEQWELVEGVQSVASHNCIVLRIF